ncbi:MAG: helix-hairpin-helix domain-containing protein [Bacteroidia bacterium]|nr:helix-hairpin-helix domain-containing protein [Bacteroidia bacterium]
MSKFESLGIPAWVQSRILTFFNEAENSTDLTEGKVKDFSTRDGSGYTLGETVAERIIEKRNSLPLKKFRSFDQLDDIQGLGEDKVRDISISMSIPADARFKDSLYGGGILYDNFILRDHSVLIEEKERFDQIVNTESLLREEVKKLIHKGCLVKKEQALACMLSVDSINHLYLETHQSTFVGAYAFAVWFMGFDEDNWFSFETIHRELDKYLNSYPDYDMRLEFGLFKGFFNGGVLAGGITVKDLPVILNHAEQRITIWSGQLND